MRWHDWEALIALDAAPASYQWNIGMALAAGASPQEIVGVLIAVAPTVGLRAWCPRLPSSPSRSDTTSTRRSKPQVSRVIGVRSEALSPTAQSATGCARVAGGDGGVVAGVARAPARCDAAVGTGGEPERHGVITGSEYGAKRQILGI